MRTEWTSDMFGFSRVEGRSVVAAFDGGMVTSDAGGLLLGAARDRLVPVYGWFTVREFGAFCPLERRTK